MDPELRSLRLRQLDASLQRYGEARQAPIPRTGWIKSIRQAIGMTSNQLAQRLGVTQPAITSLEKSEAEGSITLRSLRRAASALECELVYALVPRHSLRHLVEQRIRRLVTERVGHVAHTMALEEQSVSDAHLERQITEMVDRMMANPPKNLWA